MTSRAPDEIGVTKPLGGSVQRRNLWLTSRSARRAPSRSTWTAKTTAPGLISDLQMAVIDGGPHGICRAHAGQVNSAVLKFMA